MERRIEASMLRSLMSWRRFYWGRLRMDWLEKCLLGLRSYYRAAVAPLA